MHSLKFPNSHVWFENDCKSHHFPFFSWKSHKPHKENLERECKFQMKPELQNKSRDCQNKWKLNTDVQGWGWGTEKGLQPQKALAPYTSVAGRTRPNHRPAAVGTCGCLATVGVSLLIKGICWKLKPYDSGGGERHDIYSPNFSLEESLARLPFGPGLLLCASPAPHDPYPQNLSHISFLFLTSVFLCNLSSS